MVAMLGPVEIEDSPAPCPACGAAAIREARTTPYDPRANNPRVWLVNHRSMCPVVLALAANT